MAGKKNQAELNKFLLMVVSKITNSIDVDEIILFGSYAKGTETDDSDIDIAVVSSELDANSPSFENAIKIASKANLYEPYLQLIPFASEKYYHEEKHIDPNFIREIKRTGRQIYSKASAKELKKIA